MTNKKKLTLWDKIKFNLMVKWFNDYGFDKVISDFPECQKKIADRIFEYFKRFDDDL